MKKEPQDTTYDDLRALIVQVRAEADRRIKRVIQETVDKHEDAWYDLLMNGTDGASVTTLEILGYARTYPEERE